MAHFEVKLPNGDTAYVTAERHGYRTRLWTSYEGIGYLGSYFGNALTMVDGKPVKTPRCGTMVDFRGVKLEVKLPAKGPKDSATKLFPYFLDIINAAAAA